MQVYALITDGSRFLIPKKAETNDWWGGKSSTYSSIVNQAGQYALFGGRKDRRDRKYIDTAIRELKEESGVNLKGHEDFTEYEEKAIKPRYVYCVINLNPKSFDDVKKQAQENIKNGTVKDREMQSVTEVNKGELTQYLGKLQDIDPDTQKKIDEQNESYRHEIDWYASIANEVSSGSLSATKEGPEKDWVQKLREDGKARQEKKMGLTNSDSTISLTSTSTSTKGEGSRGGRSDSDLTHISSFSSPASTSGSGKEELQRSDLDDSLTTELNYNSSPVNASSDSEKEEFKSSDLTDSLARAIDSLSIADQSSDGKEESSHSIDSQDFQSIGSRSTSVSGKSPPSVDNDSDSKSSSPSKALLDSSDMKDVIRSLIDVHIPQTTRGSEKSTVEDQGSLNNAEEKDTKIATPRYVPPHKRAGPSK